MEGVGSLKQPEGEKTGPGPLALFPLTVGPRFRILLLLLAVGRHKNQMCVCSSNILVQKSLLNNCDGKY